MIKYNPWHTSTRSDGGQDCVEVSEAVDGSNVRIRDSKDRTGPVLAIAGAQWTTFIAQARTGGFVNA